MQHPLGFATANRAHLIAILILGLTSGACATAGAAGGRSPGFSYGYMIPGSDVGNALGISATDTIPELPASTTLPTVLDEAIKQEVASGNWNNRCTRRFRGPSVYALIFHRACDSSIGPDADPIVVVGFASSGRTVGRVRWSGPSTVTALVPVRRF